MRRLAGVLICFWIVLILPVQATDISFSVYRWQEGDFALLTPDTWSEPKLSQQDARLILTFSQNADDPAAPLIMLVRFSTTTVPSANATPLPPTPLEDILRAEMEKLGLAPTAPIPTTWLNAEGWQMFAASRNGETLARGIIAPTANNTTLMLIGTTAATQQTEFAQVYNTVVNSVLPGAGAAVTLPPYGVAWLRRSFPSDGPSAFINPSGMELGAEGHLYLVDGFAGIVQVNSVDGQVVGNIPLPNPTRLSDMALAADGTVYVADLQCGCIQQWRNNQWTIVAREFGPNAPRSITLGADGTLYATDVQVTTGSILVRALQGSQETQLLFEVPLSGQPLLATDAGGQVFVLTDQGELLRLEGAGFTSVVTLQLNLSTQGFTTLAFDAGNNLLIGTPREGILRLNAEGQEIERIGTPPRTTGGLPAAGEIANPVGIAAAEGIIYVADVWGGFASVSAFTKAIEAGRIGAEALRSGDVVQGTLQPKQRQIWTYTTRQDETIDLTVVSLQSAALDIAVRVFDPLGAEIAFNDNSEPSADLRLQNPNDAQLLNFSLAQAGTYIIVVENRRGAGEYQLGLSQQTQLEIPEANPLTVTGTLNDALPIQRWAFEGRGGQTVTITLRSVGGTLDPALVLRDARGEVVAENATAADPALGQNAQLVAVRLPNSGLYTIEAQRFGGSGTYTLEISGER